VNPSPAAWEALGTTLAALVEDEGLVLREVRRSFVFDILIARSCRELGATLVSRNFTRGGQPIGVEITAPTKFTLAALNRVLRELGFAPATRADLAPVLAA
jgi:hypothetical protein